MYIHNTPTHPFISYVFWFPFYFWILDGWWKRNDVDVFFKKKVLEDMPWHV